MQTIADARSTARTPLPLTMIYVTHILVYVLFGTAAALGAGTVLMAFMLRSRFPVLWAEWGSPVAWLWLARTPASRGFLEFLDRRSYLKTNSRGFIRLCSILRTGFYLLPVLLVLSVGAMLFAIFHDR